MTGYNQATVASVVFWKTCFS